MYGDKINTVGQLRHILKDLDDHDQLRIETCDPETGDVENLFSMYVDVIDNVRLTDDTIVREVRFCQMDYDEPQDPEIGHNEYLKKSGQMKSFDIDE